MCLDAGKISWRNRGVTPVSVCMATFNGSPYLREQINSILSQLRPYDELIISDDHSVDNTVSIVRSYDDGRIRLIQNASRRGHVRNFEDALKNATHDLILLSDQDDIWVEGRLKELVDVLCRSPKSSLAVGDFAEFDDAGLRQSGGTLGKSPACNLFQLFRLFLGNTRYFGATFALRRELLRFALPIPGYVEAHDIWIAMIACLHGGVVHVEKKTLLRRIHNGNLTPRRRRTLSKIVRSRFGYGRGLLQSALRKWD